MFEGPGPRLFALPPGVDFPALLVQGLTKRLEGAPPEAMARVTLYVNTARMRRRITDLFSAKGPGFLPRIRLVTDLGQDLCLPGQPLPTSPLRLRLELAKLIEGLLKAQPDLAPRSALYDLADSLAALIDEMQGEAVTPEKIAALNVEDHSEHWARTQAFMAIVAPLFSDTALPDAQAQQRILVETLAHLWETSPPTDPIIVAGSTGSRSTTARLMKAVAGLPNGAVILPGFDFEMPPAIWGALGDAMTAEDHPQYRFVKLLTALGLDSSNVLPWVQASPPSAARNALVSLSLRPAPVTDQWISEGRNLPDLVNPTQEITLIEAPTARDEALSIALILRHAAESGQIAALIASDRTLTRQVTAALDRWRITPDDSAGRPLALSAPGRLLRHVAHLFGQRLTSEGLLVLLKHPLTSTGGDRGNHLRFTRDLELKLRRYGPAFPNRSDLSDWARARGDPKVAEWAIWLNETLLHFDDAGEHSLSELVSRHLSVSESLARGPILRVGSGDLWEQEAGQTAQAAMAELQREAEHGNAMTPHDYRNLLEAILNRREVRETVQAHPRIMIWGTIEARVQGADLVILGGLNDGVWPQLPPPDPWMNRQMRLEAGLLLPERRIGLSAHDYQQAIGAPNVVLTRAVRDSEAETVPSRWLNRLTNLMTGLPENRGPEALAEMLSRGRYWLDLAARSEAPAAVVKSVRRPAPRPPVGTRPKKLAVTGIKTLIRDPYAIYARHILRLYKLNPLHPRPDARMRGYVLHKVLENFVRGRPDSEPRDQARSRLLAVTETVLAREVPWPAARCLWLARLDRAADFFLSVEDLLGGKSILIEEEGSADLAPLDFTLSAKPDRIDELSDRRVHIFDYKTGSPPTKDQQRKFDKQLLLEAAMAERGAFRALGGPRAVSGITYIGLGSNPKLETTSVDQAQLADVWEELRALIAEYGSPDRGYASRRAVFNERFPGDYDHLARFGEWEMTDKPEPEDVG